MTPGKTKLPIKRTVGDAYGLVFGHLGDFVALAAIPLMISVVGETLILFVQSLPEDTATAIADSVGAWAVVALTYFFMFLTIGVPWLVFLVAWHRFVLLGKRDTSRPIEFHLGRRELKFFGYGLILGLFVLITVMVIGFLALSQGFGELTLYWKWGGSISSTDILVVLLSVRFLFLFPAIAVGDDTGIATAWKQSGGVAWRLFWVLFFTALPFDLFYGIIGDPATQGPITAGGLLVALIQQLVLFLGSAVSVAALSLSYRHATQHREHGPAHAAGADRRAHPPQQQIDPRGPGAHL